MRDVPMRPAAGPDAAAGEHAIRHAAEQHSGRNNPAHQKECGGQHQRAGAEIAQHAHQRPGIGAGEAVHEDENEDQRKGADQEVDHSGFVPMERASRNTSPPESSAKRLSVEAPPAAYTAAARSRSRNCRAAPELKCAYTPCVSRATSRNMAAALGSSPSWNMKAGTPSSASAPASFATTSAFSSKASPT